MRAVGNTHRDVYEESLRLSGWIQVDGVRYETQGFQQQVVYGQGTACIIDARHGWD